jgi:hypothetical protein
MIFLEVAGDNHVNSWSGQRSRIQKCNGGGDGDGGGGDGDGDSNGSNINNKVKFSLQLIN